MSRAAAGQLPRRGTDVQSARSCLPRQLSGLAQGKNGDDDRKKRADESLPVKLAIAIQTKIQILKYTLTGFKNVGSRFAMGTFHFPALHS
ncbi:hypothetical protein [Mangrovicoccus sp. HB161399]|uniref:hypothetical protein n=1 Tax=Mangrovicoccus sp. HB161399 TaxID=2720392 RepID=UPI001557B227|nr:hypothetical protein [Mangrovicoccus sp. HB161399]